VYLCDAPGCGEGVRNCRWVGHCQEAVEETTDEDDKVLWRNAGQVWCMFESCEAGRLDRVLVLNNGCKSNKFLTLINEILVIRWNQSKMDGLQMELALKKKPRDSRSTMISEESSLMLTYWWTMPFLGPDIVFTSLNVPRI
jgi:hypothetical protein